MTVGSQMPELDWGGFFTRPRYKISGLNAPCKLGLIIFSFIQHVNLQMLLDFHHILIHPAC